MKVIEARNVNSALSQALPWLLANGIEENSRNGKVIVAPDPVMTVYQNPLERVLFSPTRDANPFFHLMESLWMLAGRNDLQFPMYFNKNFANYSDDGKTVHGAYGFRWRTWFYFDQLTAIVEELRNNPKSRRAVLTMWSPEGDLVCTDIRDGSYGAPRTGGLQSKDVPCNTHAYFDLRGEVLNMTVCNRSNDVIWGAYGANAVHFSVLQEYMAAALGVKVGVYRQFSNNFHVYTDVYGKEKLEEISEESYLRDGYCYHIDPYPMISTNIASWNQDLLNFMNDPVGTVLYNDPFFDKVAVPMFNAWKARKEKTSSGIEHMAEIIAPDWQLACTEWILRREKVH